MDIEKSPQYDLYTFTRFINHNKDKLVPSKGHSVRCLYSTIINRCYYSSYLYALFWLEDKFKFQLKMPFEFDDEEYITEHKQVRLALKDKGLEPISSELADLFKLRKKADYDPLIDISIEELNDAIESMELIFKKLNF